MLAMAIHALRPRITKVPATAVRTSMVICWSCCFKAHAHRSSNWVAAAVALPCLLVLGMWHCRWSDTAAKEARGSEAPPTHWPLHLRGFGVARVRRQMRC